MYASAFHIFFLLCFFHSPKDKRKSKHHLHLLRFTQFRCGARKRHTIILNERTIAMIVAIINAVVLLSRSRGTAKRITVAKRRAAVKEGCRNNIINGNIPPWRNHTKRLHALMAYIVTRILNTHIYTDGLLKAWNSLRRMFV